MWPRSLAARSIGAGDVSLTRSACRGVDAHDLARAVHATLEAGIDLVDISPEDDTERLVGEAIRALRLRDRALPIARVRAITSTPTGNFTHDVLRERLPLRYLVERIERSLRALRLDALPVVALELRATWRSSPLWPELVETCARLVRDGKVLHYGAYLDRIEDDTATLLDEPWLDAISVPFSLCERAAEPLLARARELRRPADTDNPTRTPATPAMPEVDPALAAAAARDPNIAAVIAASLTGEGLVGTNLSATPSRAHALVDPHLAATDPVVAAALARDPKLAAALGIELPRAATRDVAILARRPLAGGALAGTLGPGAKLRKDDDRALDATTLERIAVGAAKLAALVKEMPPAARSCDAAKAELDRRTRPEHVECETLPELALRFAIDRGTIPLPRLHHPEHVTDALAARISPPLPRDLTETLDTDRLFS